MTDFFCWGHSWDIPGDIEGHCYSMTNATIIHSHPSRTFPTPLLADNDRLVFSVAEAGELLGISRAFAYELVARGELPVIRLGRRRLVPKRALLELVAWTPPPSPDRSPSLPSQMATRSDLPTIVHPGSLHTSADPGGSVLSASSAYARVGESVAAQLAPRPRRPMPIEGGGTGNAHAASRPPRARAIRCVQPPGKSPGIGPLRSGRRSSVGSSRASISAWPTTGFPNLRVMLTFGVHRHLLKSVPARLPGDYVTAIVRGNRHGPPKWLQDWLQKFDPLRNWQRA